MTKPKPKRTKAGTSKASAEDKKRLFVEAYLSNNGNLTQSALAAGYSKGGAAKQGYRMSKDPAIMSMLDIRRKSILGSLEITTDRVLRETARLAFVDPRRLIHSDGQHKGKMKTLDELDADIAAAIQSVEQDEYGRIKYKFWDKNSPLERLFKHLNLYDDDNRGKQPITQVAIVNLVPLQPLPPAIEGKASVDPG